MINLWIIIQYYRTDSLSQFGRIKVKKQNNSNPVIGNFWVIFPLCFKLRPTGSAKPFTPAFLVWTSLGSHPKSTCTSTKQSICYTTYHCYPTCTVHTVELFICHHSTWNWKWNYSLPLTHFIVFYNACMYMLYTVHGTEEIIHSFIYSSSRK